MTKTKEKIIDFEKKGNVVRFYIGTADDYYGDDWNDVPYEHNAGRVYDEYVTRIIDIAFPFDMTVTEASDDWAYENNTPFCKDVLKNGDIPCIVAIPEEVNQYDPSFSKYAASTRCVRFFFNQPVETVLECPSAVVLKDIRKET